MPDGYREILRVARTRKRRKKQSEACAELSADLVEYANRDRVRSGRRANLLKTARRRRNTEIGKWTRNISRLSVAFIGTELTHESADEPSRRRSMRIRFRVRQERYIAPTFQHLHRILRDAYTGCFSLVSSEKLSFIIYGFFEAIWNRRLLIEISIILVL